MRRITLEVSCQCRLCACCLPSRALPRPGLTGAPPSHVLQVIRDFADDGVVYLELRTTPRATDSGMTASSYVLAVLDAIERCRLDGVACETRLILSINRAEPLCVRAVLSQSRCCLFPSPCLSLCLYSRVLCRRRQCEGHGDCEAGCHFAGRWPPGGRH